MIGDPYGNRTHDSALRGPRLNRLTNGPHYFDSIARENKIDKSFFEKSVEKLCIPCYNKQVLKAQFTYHCSI